MTTKIQGQLEIDHNRGVIYFHSNRGITVLRICRLGTIPSDAVHIDITHKVGVMIERDLGAQPPVVTDWDEVARSLEASGDITITE